MARRKKGPKPKEDVPRYADGRIRGSYYANYQDLGTLRAAARRAALVNPDGAAEAVRQAAALIKDANRAAKERGLSPITAASAARLVDEAIAGCAAVNADPRVETALGRYFLGARTQGVRYRLGEAHYAAGAIYAGIHAAVWSGVRDDIVAEFGAEGVRALESLGAVTVQRRRLPGLLGRLAATTLAVELEPMPDLGPAEAEERRQRLWRRYREARDTLAGIDPLVLRAIDELVIEDRDPWWLDPLPDRLKKTEAEIAKETVGETREREAAARTRANRVFAERSRIRAGLKALAVLFGTNKDEAAPAPVRKSPILDHYGEALVEVPAGDERVAQTIPAASARRAVERRRLPTGDIQFYRSDVAIDAAALASAVNRLRGKTAPPDN